MRQLITAFLLLSVTLSFFSWRQNQAKAFQPVEQIILELQKESPGSHVVITENHWSHLVHRLWRPDSPSLVLPMRDIKNSYLKKKKKFRCQRPVYWLGEQKPPKKLKSLGSWKRVGHPSEKTHSLHLYQVK